MSSPLLELRDVKTHFPIHHGLIFQHHVGTVKAVDGVTLSIGSGEVLGLVGESGCGKSTLARTIMQLLPTTAGTVILEGRNLTSASVEDVRVVRRNLQMVFQDPYASLNPRITVFDTLAEPLRVHRVCPDAEIPARVAGLMQRVGLAPRYLQKYPHEFSGGQRQRIAIARALALEPKIIIADEPVSALDVSIQAQILNLLSQLRRQMNLSLLFIAHDLSVVKHISDRIAVMYLGKVAFDVVFGRRVVDAQVARQAVGAHAVNQAKVDHLGVAPLLAADLVHRQTKHFRRRGPVHVQAVVKGV